MSRTIREETRRSDRLGSLTLHDLVNDSERWNPTGDYALSDPYFEQTNPENKDEFGELTLNDRVNVVDYSDSDEIPQAHVNLHDLLADYVLEQKDFLVFVGLLQQVFDDIKSVADVFDQLSDVESVVEMFLPKLSYLVNYRYRYDVPDHINRDIIRRLLWLYEQKATEKDVLESADYGGNDKWVGSTLFLPDAVPEDRTAEIYYPVHSLFTHDISAFDRSDRYPDSSRYRGGVIVIKVKKLNNRIREAVRRVLPAGLKCYYDFDGSMGGDGTNGAVDFGSWCEVFEDTLLDQALFIEDHNDTRGFDGDYRYKHYFSGKQIMFCDTLIYYLLGVSWFPDLPEDDPEGNVLHDPDDYHFEIPAPRRIWTGYRTYSDRGSFDGKLRLEGEGNTQWVQTPIYPVKPTDSYYPVSEVEDLVVNTRIDDSRYHQVYLGDGRYAMNSFWDSPEHFSPEDWVETGDRHVAKFSDISVRDYIVNGLLPRSYSNHFYLEDYNEPFELRTDRLLRLEMGIADYALPLEIPIDLIVNRDMGFTPEVHSDAFDGTRTFGHVFDGRGRDEQDFDLQFIRDPFLRLEMVLDHEDTGTDVFDGEETPLGEVRSGLPYFWTYPFEVKGTETRHLELVIEEHEVDSTTLSGEETDLGEVRSGIYDDYTYPFDISPTPPDRILEMMVGKEVDSDTFDGEPTDRGDVRSGLTEFHSDPIEVTVVKRRGRAAQAAKARAEGKSET